VLALFLLVSIAVAVWVLNAPALRFLPSFARLLADPVVEGGAWSLLSGRSTASGTFDGRDVAILLRLKRGRHDQGYLVVAMRTSGPVALDAAGIDARASEDGARRALFELARHDLRLHVEDGWLKAVWQPHGFVIFPGGFSESRWRDVLQALQAVAASLDAVRVPVT
jgi:hypothetical protein